MGEKCSCAGWQLWVDIGVDCAGCRQPQLRTPLVCFVVLYPSLLMSFIQLCCCCAGHHLLPQERQTICEYP